MWWNDVGSPVAIIDADLFVPLSIQQTDLSVPFFFLRKRQKGLGHGLCLLWGELLHGIAYDLKVSQHEEISGNALEFVCDEFLMSRDFLATLNLDSEELSLDFLHIKEPSRSANGYDG